jgi:hypothetical protein
VNDANSRAGGTTSVSGRRVTGVAGIKCARHAFVERMADLQKGERYVMQAHSLRPISCNRRFLNMDYVIFDALRDCELERVALTYDIWCKWSIHAEKRAREHFPADMTNGFLRLARRGFIPKLHIYSE